jgi:HAE1 family hydrophobic/amphiphilic exporter-1
VTFDIATNPNIDQVNVQNRIAQAQPNLPTDVNQFGLTLRKITGLPMMLVSLSSPKKTYDALFLANYANINIVDALYRVPGVGQVLIFGAGDYAICGSSRPSGDDGPHGARPRAGDSATGTVNPSGQLRAQQVGRSGDDLHRPGPRAAANTRRVRHRPALESRRLRGPHEGWRGLTRR